MKKDHSDKDVRSGSHLRSLCLVSHLGNEDKTALELLDVPVQSPPQNLDFFPYDCAPWDSCISSVHI